MTTFCTSPSRALMLVLAAMAPACADAPEDSSDLEWRSDDFDDIDPEAWSVLNPSMAESVLGDGLLRLRPSSSTAWYESQQAFHQYVELTGNFVMTTNVTVGDMAGGTAIPDWSLGGLLVRDPNSTSTTYQVALGTAGAPLSTGLVAQHMSTIAGSSSSGLSSNLGGTGQLRICRVGTNIRALFRADATSAWTTLDQRDRPDLPATVAAGPTAYSYASTGNFEAAFEYVDFDPATTVDDCTATFSETSAGGESASAGDDGASDDGDEGDGGIPTSTSTCPAIQDGIVSLCPAGLGGACRNVMISNASGATPTGPLQVHWHGTGESPDNLLAWDPVTSSISTMVQAQGGIMVLPYADSDALARSVGFPWWTVGDTTDASMQTSREDDFLLFDEAVACILEAGLASPNRINASGFSAGGIMTSQIVERRDYLASAVSFSGGTPPDYEPAVPLSSAPVMAIHGGPTDQYCGPGAPGGGCLDFQTTTETLAAGVVAAGHWSFVCDHRGGHMANLGLHAAQFMELATAGETHPWSSYTIGSTGDWIIDNYCHASGQPSPWD